MSDERNRYQKAKPENLPKLLDEFYELSAEYLNVPPDDDTFNMLLRKAGARNLTEEEEDALEEVVNMNLGAVSWSIREGVEPGQAFGNLAAVCIAYGIYLAKQGLV